MQINMYSIVLNIKTYVFITFFNLVADNKQTDQDNLFC